MLQLHPFKHILDGRNRSHESASKWMDPYRVRWRARDALLWYTGSRSSIHQLITLKVDFAEHHGEDTESTGSTRGPLHPQQLKQRWFTITTIIGESRLCPWRHSCHEMRMQNSESRINQKGGWLRREHLVFHRLMEARLLSKGERAGCRASTPRTWAIGNEKRRHFQEALQYRIGASGIVKGERGIARLVTTGELRKLLDLCYYITYVGHCWQIVRMKDW